MNQRLIMLSLVIDEYDKAIDYYTKTLGFNLIEDTTLSETKRWVIVAPDGEGGAHLLLAKAANADQELAIGNQSGGRVFLFLHTDDFDRDYFTLMAKGVHFVNGPRIEPYGKVGVFKDLYGNLWDLIEPKIV